MNITEQKKFSDSIELRRLERERKEKLNQVNEYMTVQDISTLISESNCVTQYSILLNDTVECFLFGKTLVMKKDTAHKFITAFLKDKQEVVKQKALLTAKKEKEKIEKIKEKAEKEKVKAEQKAKREVERAEKVKAHAVQRAEREKVRLEKDKVQKEKRIKSQVEQLKNLSKMYTDTKSDEIKTLFNEFRNICEVESIKLFESSVEN